MSRLGHGLDIWGFVVSDPTGCALKLTNHLPASRAGVEKEWFMPPLLHMPSQRSLGQLYVTVLCLQGIWRIASRYCRNVDCARLVLWNRYIRIHSNTFRCTCLNSIIFSFRQLQLIQRPYLLYHPWTSPCFRTWSPCARFTVVSSVFTKKCSDGGTIYSRNLPTSYCVQHYITAAYDGSSFNKHT